MARKHTRKHGRKHGRRHTVKVYRGGVAGSSGFDAQKLRNIKIKMKNAALKKAQNNAALKKAQNNAAQKKAQNNATPKPFQVITQNIPTPINNRPFTKLIPMRAEAMSVPSSYSNEIQLTPIEATLPITKAKYNMLNNALVKLNNATAAVHKAMNSIKQ